MEKGGNQVPVIFFRPSGRFSYACSLEDRRAMLSRSIKSRVFFLRVYSGLWFEWVISLWLAIHSTRSWRLSGHTVQTFRNPRAVFMFIHTRLLPPFFGVAVRMYLPFCLAYYRRASGTCPEICFHVNPVSCQIESPCKHHIAPGDLIMYKAVGF